MFNASSNIIILTTFIANIISILGTIVTLILGFRDSSLSKNEENFNKLIQSERFRNKLDNFQNEDDKIREIKGALIKRSKTLKRISVFGILMILLLTILLVYVLKNPDYKSKTEVSYLFDKQTAFDKIQGQFKVLILPFIKPINSNDYNLERFLKNRFIELRDDKNLNLAVKFIDYQSARSFKEAKSIGEKFNADIVIFGEYDIDVKKTQLCYIIINKETQKIKDKVKANFTHFEGLSDISQGYLQKDIEEIMYWTLGIKALKVADYEKSIDYLSYINIENSPLRDEILKIKLICFLKIANENDFEVYSNHLLQNNPFNFSYFELAYFISQYNDDNDLVIKMYNQRLHFEKDVAAFNNIAVAYENDGAYKQAERYYKLALQNRKEALYYSNLANLYANDYFKKYNLSEKLYLNAIKIDRTNPLYYNDLGNLYCLDNFKDYTKAKNLYLKAIKVCPEYLYSYFNIAHLESSYNSKIDSAFHYIDMAYEKDKNNSNVYYEYGKLYQYYKRKYHKAKEYYIKAIELDGTNAYAYLNLGDLYKENYKFYSKAEENYRIAISIAPNHSYFYNKLGVLLLNKHKEYSEAFSSFQKALSQKDLSNNDKSIYFANCGVVFENQKKYSEAEKYYLQSLTFNSDYLFANMRLYCVYDKAGKYQKAMEYYKKTCKLNSKYENTVLSISLKLKDFFYAVSN